MTFCLIIVLTIYLTSRTDLMHENLTGVMAIEKYHNISILFIIFCACFFAYKTHAIYKKTFVHNRIYNIVIILTAVIMIVGALSPYTLNSRDFFSLLHVYCSMLSCLSFLCLLWIYTRKLLLLDITLYQSLHWFYDLSLQFLAILTLLFAKVNSYIEILFAFLVCTYLFMIEKRIRQKN